MINPSPFLRRALQIDALFSGVSALLLVFGASFLAPLTNLPEGFLRNTGLVLVVFVLGVGYLASRHVMPKGAVVAVIAINAVWTIGSIALLVSGWLSPNLLGQLFIVMQAIAVGVFAGWNSSACAGARTPSRLAKHFLTKKPGGPVFRPAFSASIQFYRCPFRPFNSPRLRSNRCHGSRTCRSLKRTLATKPKRMPMRSIIVCRWCCCANAAANS
jgi:hypothetical protein